MNILAIETSCDETSVAIVSDGRHIRANVIASQIALHRKYGGVVPELASRQHVLTIIPVLEEALQQAGADWKEIDAVAVTRGPGLSPALLVGVNAAKALAFSRQKALLGVNHMEGHIYSNWLIPQGTTTDGEKEPAFPALCLIVSGGHTELVLMTGHGQYRLLGKTVDDAAGEAFDKAARILGLGYPGGPAVQKAAEGGNSTRFALPRAQMKGTYDFSFSGLKTALLRKVQEYGVIGSKPQPWQITAQADAASSKRETNQVKSEITPARSGESNITDKLLPYLQTVSLSSFTADLTEPEEQSRLAVVTVAPALDDPEDRFEAIVDRELPVADLAASFQAALVDVLVEKTVAAALEFGVREVLVAGGVAANSYLRGRLELALSQPRLKVPFRYPPLVLCTDNAAMIAAAAFYRYAESVQHDFSMDIEPSARYV
ncbi:MAG: tRNA (adenosine(37)-N6)-threonylcarbamoyltransferase complex transferase subunit TsaD [Chloroflexia bacterium]